MSHQLHRVESPLWRTDTYEVDAESGEIVHVGGGVVGYGDSEVRYECDCGGEFHSLSEGFRHLVEESFTE